VIYAFFCGGASALALVASVIFLRYWRHTRDRFFVIWAASLTLMAAQWAVSAFTGGWETSAAGYLLRLAAFLFIIAAIVDKNRGGGGIRQRETQDLAQLDRRSSGGGRGRLGVAKAAAPTGRASARRSRIQPLS
jgi:L-lactate permease